MPTENNPRVVFERLFGDGGTSAARLAQARENRSILDSVNGELGAAAADRSVPAIARRSSDYVDSVREVERRIQSAEKNAATTDAARAGTADGHSRAVRRARQR